MPACGWPYPVPPVLLARRYRGIIEFATRASTIAPSPQPHDLARHTPTFGPPHSNWKSQHCCAADRSTTRRPEADLVTKADAGDDDAAGQLARLLAERNDVAQLTARADNDDRLAAIRLPCIWPTAGASISSPPAPIRATQPPPDA
jgi:hypothetical protein